MTDNENDQRRFAFFELRGRHELTFMRRPHYLSWIDAIGEAGIYSAEEIDKLPLSKTLKSRVAKCKLGSKIKMHYLHSTGDVYLLCLTKDVIEKVKSSTERYYDLCTQTQSHENSLKKLLKSLI